MSQQVQTMNSHQQAQISSQPYFQPTTLNRSTSLSNFNYDILPLEDMDSDPESYDLLDEMLFSGLNATPSAIRMSSEQVYNQQVYSGDLGGYMPNQFAQQQQQQQPLQVHQYQPNQAQTQAQMQPVQTQISSPGVIGELKILHNVKGQRNMVEIREAESIRVTAKKDRNNNNNNKATISPSGTNNLSPGHAHTENESDHSDGTGSKKAGSTPPGKMLQIRLQLHSGFKEDINVVAIALDDVGRGERYLAFAEDEKEPEPTKKAKAKVDVSSISEKFIVTDFVKNRNNWVSDENGRSITYKVRLLHLGSPLRFSTIVTVGNNVEDYWETFSVKFISHNDGKRSQTSPTRKAAKGAGAGAAAANPGVHLLPGAPAFTFVDNAFDVSGGAVVPRKTSSHEVEGDYLDSFRANNKRARGKWTEIEGSLSVEEDVKAYRFLEHSDLRLKTNISDLTDALEIVMSLQGKSYQWKANQIEGSQGGPRVIGLIAQEVQKVMPEVVATNSETGYLSVHYTALVPILIEAMKEHVRQTEKKNQEFEGILDNLQERVKSLEVNRTVSPQKALPKDKPVPAAHAKEISGEDVATALEEKRFKVWKKIVAEVVKEGERYAAGAVVILDWNFHFLQCGASLIVSSHQTKRALQTFVGEIALVDERKYRAVYLKFKGKKPIDFSVAVDFSGDKFSNLLNSRSVVSVIDLKNTAQKKQISSSNARQLTNGDKWLVGNFNWNSPAHTVNWTYRCNTCTNFIPKGDVIPDKQEFSRLKKVAKEQWRKEFQVEKPKLKAMSQPEKKDFKNRSAQKWMEKNLNKTFGAKSA
eukprot:TRINITY_DN12339_c0_g1_i1.p1 TRINITY_DN12339_c0_g1~~TRINITY_DN12339_c0_g1_i1.p1  ORF type:complete len:811 (+),score=332.91 TRINITY_DN12339_c0_g1_i1:112-2544(+)